MRAAGHGSIPWMGGRPLLMSSRPRAGPDGRRPSGPDPQVDGGLLSTQSTGHAIMAYPLDSGGCGHDPYRHRAPRVWAVPWITSYQAKALGPIRSRSGPTRSA